jgi:hypothetical protein
MTDQLRLVIDEIMKDFKFAKVQRVMETLNWRWLPLGRVPTVSDLRKTARELLTEAANGGDGCCCETGGFSASNNMSTEVGDEGAHLTLEFTLESSAYNEEWLKDEEGEVVR